MTQHKTYRLHFMLLSLVLVLLFFINISLGTVLIPIKSIFQILIGQTIEKETWELIVFTYRLPKALTAIFVGIGLSVSGLLMQTLFRNPLAGPFVLGLSSGASLGVAILILGSSTLGGLFGYVFIDNLSIAIAATLGSLVVLLTVVTVSYRVKDAMAILIIGLMFGSITTAIVSVLSFFSTAEELQQYVFWSFGSLGNLNWQEITIFSLAICLGVILSIKSIKHLNALLLGENYAKSMGVQIKVVRLILIIATSILAGSVTAFAGPIAFIGLAVPHLTKLIFDTSNHKILIPAVMIFGASLMLICDIIAQLPGSELTLPINAVTSLVGGPVVIWLLLRKKKLNF